MKMNKKDLRWMIKQELKKILDSYDQERVPGKEEGIEWFDEQNVKDDEHQELDEELGGAGRPGKEEMKQVCGDYGYYDLPRLLKVMNSIQLASKGQYVKPPPKGG